MRGRQVRAVTFEEITREQELQESCTSQKNLHLPWKTSQKLRENQYIFHSVPPFMENKEKTYTKSKRSLSDFVGQALFSTILQNTGKFRKENVWKAVSFFAFKSAPWRALFRFAIVRVLDARTKLVKDSFFECLRYSYLIRSKMDTSEERILNHLEEDIREVYGTLFKKDKSGDPNTSYYRQAQFRDICY